MRASTLRTTALLAAALAITGCATMSKDECRTVDWRTVGYEDGANGYAADRIAQHRKACAKHHVTPDLDAYLSGRDEGLREYCQPANGFRVGSSGSAYNGQCPTDLNRAFVDAYDAGRQLHQLQSRLNTCEQQLGSKRREIEHAEDEIVRQSALAISSEATAEQRAQAVVDVKHLGERVGRLKSEVRQLEKDRVVYEHELEDYQASLEYGR